MNWWHSLDRRSTKILNKTTTIKQDRIDDNSHVVNPFKVHKHKQDNLQVDRDELRIYQIIV